MSIEKSLITLHMVCSLDGFIAKKDGGIDWMHTADRYEKGIKLSDAEITEFLDSVDCYVMGSHTYEHALELGWPYGDTPVVVLSTRVLKAHKDNVTIQSGDLRELVHEHLRALHTNIWIVGGSELTRKFLQQELADEIVITILPVILGDGIPFFDAVGKTIPLHLKDVKAFTDGMVEVTYEINPISS